MDCTILWMTKTTKKDVIYSARLEPESDFVWIRKSHRLLYRMGNITNGMRESLDIGVSIMATVVLLIAGIIACRLWKWWNKMKQRGDDRRRDGNFKILDLETDSVWTNQMRNGYGACSKDSEHDSNHYQML